MWLSVICLVMSVITVITTHHTPCTPDVQTMVVYYRANVIESGPTLNQHWENVSCFLSTVAKRGYWRF